MVPVVGRRSADDHGAALGHFRVLGELPGHLYYGVASDAGVLLLPCRRKAPVIVVVPAVIAAETLPRHAVLRHVEVEDGRYGHPALGLGLHVFDRDLPLVLLGLVLLVNENVE